MAKDSGSCQSGHRTAWPANPRGWIARSPPSSGDRPVTCRPSDSIESVLRTMGAEGLGSLIVTGADREPLGIFTLHDLLSRVALPRKDLADPISVGDEPRAGHALLHGHGLRRGARDGPAGSPPHHRGRPGEGDRDRLGEGPLRPPAPQPAAALQRDQERRRRRRARGPGEGSPPPGAVAAGGGGLLRAADPVDLLAQRSADAAHSRTGVRGPGPAGDRLLLDRARQRGAARADALHGPGQRPRSSNCPRASKPTPRGRSCCRSRSG